MYRLFLITFLSLLLFCYSYRTISNKKIYNTITKTTATTTQQLSSTVLYYQFLNRKDGEKKEIGRLIKNILFPGIYREYADTKETIKTVKVSTTYTNNKVMKKIRSFDDVETGKYNVADEKTVPVYSSMSSVKEPKLKPVKKPMNFVAPTPKKGIAIGKGVDVLPNITVRNKKPIVIYEQEADSDCKKVREACTLLDLTVEFRPCPGSNNLLLDDFFLIQFPVRKFICREITV